jgi:hypothetical protein
VEKLGISLLAPMAIIDLIPRRSSAKRGLADFTGGETKSKAFRLGQSANHGM